MYHQIKCMKNLLNIKILFILFCGIALTALPASSGPFIHIDNLDTEKDYPYINIHITVNNLDQKEFPLLDDNNLRVYEDGFRVNNINIINISDTRDFLYLVMSIDSSKSINRKFLKSIKSAAREIVNSSSPRDRVALYRFNDNVTRLNTFIMNKKELVQNINSIERHGKKTLLYNAIYDSIELLNHVKQNKRAVIVFTDGKDEGSSVTVKDIITFSRDAALPIYFICLKKSVNKKNLARISKLTGGKMVYSSDQNNVAGMYRTILSVIKRNRYHLKYKSTLNSDGENHLIEVKLKYNDIRDRESATITSRRSFSFLGGDSLVLNILLICILLMLMAIFILLFIYYKRERKKDKMQSTIAGRGRSTDTVAQAIQLEAEERYQEQQTLNEYDPEYHYARAWLIQKEGPATGKKYPIYWEECSIGREKDNSIIIEDSAVSPYQAKIKQVKKSFYIYDLVSENGTYLNGKKLLRPKALFDWDEIKMGRTIFIFRGSKLAHS